MQQISIGKLNLVVAPTSAREALMNLANRNGWHEPQPVSLEDPQWWYEPLVDFSVLPKSGRKRLEKVLKAIPVQAVMLGHEVQPQTPVKPIWIVRPEKPEVVPVKPKPWIVVPDPENPGFVPWTAPTPDINWKEVGRVSWAVTKVVAKVVGIALLATLFVVAALGGAAGEMCLKDPQVVVLVEGEWYEIYSYYA